MGTWRVAAAALVMVGCNAVFGVESPELAPSDRDHDGILDENDNCPSAANSDQADRDGDGFGDVCDGCPDLSSAANHDEDRDGVGDECDACPAIPDFQDDEDGDRIGDPCDRLSSTTPTIRLVFDPFTELTASWEGADAWRTSGDSVAPVAPLEPGTLGLHAPTMELKSTFTLTAGFVSTAPWQAGDTFGIILHRVSDGAPFATCIVRCEPDCEMATGTAANPTAQQPAPPVPVTSLQVTLGFNASLIPGLGTVGCGLGGEARDFVYLGSPVPVWPELIATQSVELAYVDVMQ